MLNTLPHIRKIPRIGLMHILYYFNRQDYIMMLTDYRSILLLAKMRIEKLEHAMSRVHKQQ